MDGKPRENASGLPQEEDLEFKPIVKYAGVALAAIVLLGVEYATYRFGIQRGRTEAMASGNVTESVNNAAVENLTHFMQVAAADDHALRDAVKNRQKDLAWIKDPAIRREAEWTLAQALIDRGLAHEGAELLAELASQAPPSGAWARRILLAARAMADEGYKDAALAYYQCAAERFEALQAQSEQLEAFSEMAELLASSSSKMEDGVIPALDALQHKAAGLGEAGKGLRANILAYMGRLHRVHGNQEAALKCFEQALSGTDTQKTPELASAAVCFGSALLEKGDAARAAEWLRDGVKRLGDGPADVPYLVTALRDLARLEQEAGRTDSALALLYRAEGAATGRISETSAFWICLYDQRGWANYTRGEYEIALADFTRALAQKHSPKEMLPQPLEGAGRCSLALGKGEDAVLYLQRNLSLREQLFADDAPALGRANLLLGQACDLNGDTEGAAASYGRAVGLLPADTDNADRLHAMLGQAYALSQLQKWDAAAEAWKNIQPLVKDDVARQKEAEAQLQLCQRRSSAVLAAENGRNDDAASSDATPRQRPRPTRRR